MKCRHSWVEGGGKSGRILYVHTKVNVADFEILQTHLFSGRIDGVEFVCSR